MAVSERPAAETVTNETLADNGAQTRQTTLPSRSCKAPCGARVQFPGIPPPSVPLAASRVEKGDRHRTASAFRGVFTCQFGASPLFPVETDPEPDSLPDSVAK
jgi:hypothetical protein